MTKPTRKETFEVVKGVLTRNFGDKAEGATEDTHFVNDIGGDSLDQVEVVMDIENELEISIGDDELQPFLEGDSSHKIGTLVDITHRIRLQTAELA